MTQFNPITAGPVQSSAAQRMLADDKAAQLRRNEQSKRGSATDSFEPRVQNTEEVDPAGDEKQQKNKQPQQRKSKKRKRGADETDPTKTIDIRA